PRHGAVARQSIRVRPQRVPGVRPVPGPPPRRPPGQKPVLRTAGGRAGRRAVPLAANPHAYAFRPLPGIDPAIRVDVLAVLPADQLPVNPGADADRAGVDAA